MTISTKGRWSRDTLMPLIAMMKNPEQRIASGVLLTMVVESRTSFVDFLRNGLARFVLALKVVYQAIIEIDGRRGAGRWYLIETVNLKGADESRITIGCYVGKCI